MLLSLASTSMSSTDPSAAAALASRFPALYQLNGANAVSRLDLRADLTKACSRWETNTGGSLA